MKNFLALLILISLTAAPFPHQANGGEIEGTRFETSVSDGSTELTLVGVGLLRYWGIKAYKGAFYLEEGIDVSNFSTNNAKRLELEYMRSFKGEDFGKATTKSLQKLLDPDAFIRLKSKIDYHNSLYEDVNPGDRYSLTYIPGVGTELALNGQAKGIIEGAEFAAAIFSIWVGSDPISESFKKQILGLS